MCQITRFEVGKALGSTRSQVDSRYVFTTLIRDIQDLQDIACKGGYNIKGRDRRDLEKIVELVQNKLTIGML